MSWITLTSVTATNGQKTVAVNSGSTATIKIGDALKIGAFDIYEIEGVFANQLTLRDAWAHATQTNAKAVVVPTFGDFNAAVTAMRDLTDVAINNLSAIEDWGTKSGNVTFQGKGGQSHDARTMQQMDADVADLEAQASNLIINVSGRGFARSEADMLAMRAANAPKFAASGMIHAGKHQSSSIYIPINEGLWSIPTPSYKNSLVIGTEANPAGSSETNYAVFNLAGFTVSLRAMNSSNLKFATVKFPDAPDGTVTYDSATGAVVKHPDAATAFASETATNKVVTERVDLAGLEGYLEQITADKPYIYPYGCIQSQATTVDGIATTVDTIRPITYFAVFDGDESSRGRGWNINTLTDAQKEKIFSNPEHNIFRMNNGDLVQFRVRQRTIAGAGNGDWEQIDSASLEDFRYKTDVQVGAHGARDSVDSFVPVSNQDKYTTFPSHITGRSFRGMFSTRTVNNQVAYNGECYFYVLATVLRLNQGAYHPSFNPLGTKKWQKQSALGANSWHQGDIGDNLVKSIAFNQTLTTGVVGARENTGAIGQDSGRPDGKFYDAIYPDGQGGVIDRRLSAFPVTMEDYFKAMAKAENGTMRGMEKLVRTYIIEARGSSAIWYQSSNNTIDIAGNGKGPIVKSEYEVGGKVSFVSDAGVVLTGKCVSNSTATVIAVEVMAGAPSQGLMEGVLVVEVTKDTNIRKDQSIIGVKKGPNASVSGNFLQTDVSGHPANILQVDALKNGWMGAWTGFTYESTGNIVFTRDVVIDPVSKLVNTSDFGATWSTANALIDTVTNSSATTLPAGTVRIDQYTASAKLTKPSAVLPVYGHRTGLGDVSASSWYGGSGNGMPRLAESLMGKILKSASGWPDLAMSLKVLSSNIRGDNGKVENINKHEPIPLVAPLNNSPAIKLLPHAVSENGQALLGYFWNELKYGDPEFVSFDSSVSTLFLANKVYRCTAGKHAGRIFQCVSNSTVAIDAYYIDDSGKLVTSTGGTVSALRLWSGNKWGDDGTMLVIDNTGTYNNLNGESCLYGYAVSALPIGWVDNHARFGAQVQGVDL
ncbi:hypothetical protein [Vibrio navarrensis]|uniref:hypothetical protein n=1 Tax=Vibrio navarrensis TaxID=29495 RepID=UPI0018690F78|nr:hypothetical protein [Vibrio navarrensis]MBE3653505.1 hypothetical protein [Vibrio navarrensis]